MTFVISITECRAQWQGKVLCLHDADDKVIMMILFIMVSHYKLDIHVSILKIIMVRQIEQYA